MQNRIHHLCRDEQGMSFVFVGIGFTAFLAATTLAIDVGMFMNARTQAQNSADAGALAGATALVFNGYNNRASSGPAVQGAISAATANKVIGTAPTVLPADVTFPLGPTGVDNRVQVFVHRSGPNAVPTLMGALFGVSSVDINAVATAEASPANAMTCVKPFMIPDKWKENTNPPWDTGDTFEAYDNKGNPLPNADVFIDANDPVNYTGYTTARDAGTVLTLRAGTGSNINPSFYFSWKMPDDIGGNFYRENIAMCNSSMMHSGDKIIQEPGDKSGPTIQGIEDLIAKDPNAHWDTGCNCVKGSAFPISPRVFPIPLYNPQYYADGKKNGRVADFEITNFLGFFAEPPKGNSIPGRITQIIGIVDPNASPAPAAAFPMSIRLVQ
jgi:hypothetical protein